MSLGIPTVLRVPAFRNVWLATVASNGGTWLQAVAAGWLVLQITGSATMVGLLALAYRGPAILLSTWGGKLADRYDWRVVGIVTFLIQGVAALALAILSWVGLLSVGAIFAVTAVMGAGFAVGLPSVLALVPALVPTTRLQDAVALNAVGVNVARMVGPMVGGVMLVFGGAEWCFALNAVSFLALVVALAVLPRLPQGPRIPERLRVAVRYAFTDRAARRLLVGMSVFMLFAGPVQELAPVIARRLGGGPVTLGMILGGMGLGALLGAWVLTELSARGMPRHLAIPVATLAFGVALGVVAASPWTWLTIPAMVLAGAVWIWILTLTNAAIQLSSPSGMLGRMLGFYQLAVITPVAVGSVGFGALAGWLGIGGSMAIAALALVAWGGWTLRYQVDEIDRDIRTIRT
ncbi:MAG: MFS transporter [Thermoleophilia bacterium]|nr:MFS transporter [Thermoleophilia bacterium]